MSDSPLEALVGARLRIIRRRKGLSIDHMARATGIPRSVVARLELGQQGARLSQLDALADACGVNVGSVIAGIKRKAG